LFQHAAYYLIVGSTCLLTGCGSTLNDGMGTATQPGLAASEMALSGVTPNQHPVETSSLTLTGRDSQQALQLAAASDPSSSAYKIGPLDILDVTVFRVAELSKMVQVAATGTINLPLVGEIPAAGRTTQQVERDLTKRLGAKYLQSPQVNVTIREYNSQRVTIDGAVRKPGVYPIRGDTTLLQMIATAEGLTDTANTEIAVFRKTEGKRLAAKFDVDEIRSGRAKDPKISQGDLIVISDSALKTTYQGLLKALPVTSMFVTFL
jgi:polysaccharide export outer membrane protein